MAEGPEASTHGRGRFFAYAPVVLWAALILVLGSSPGSSAQTSRFIKPVIEFFFPSADPDTFLIVHAAIRKAAHFIEYAVLALLSARAFLGSRKPEVYRWAWALAIAVVGAVAAADEINQSFYVTRTSSPWDVALDITGGAFALIFLMVVRRRKVRRRP